MATNGVNDFGQAEDLSERLRGLLKAYHGDLDLVTELLQNSDDAGATKLHLVLDVTDTHANAFVPRDPFAKAWKELHGPALLAWNDRTFSPEDMVGIQRLGTRSKRDALMKKGRFGVGANIMYMVTDCPAFISDDETLNIFDPCRHFTEKAKNSPKPGAQLERNAVVQHGEVYQKFCIDKNHPLRGATAFRLALPLPGTKPRIAEQPMSVEKMRQFFMKVFADEGQCLLFLQSVRELKLLGKRADGAVVELVSFSVHLSSEGNFKLGKFFEKCTEFEQIRKSWKEGQPEPTNSCPPSSISHQLDLVVSKGGRIPTRSEWLVCLQVGCSKSCSAADAGLIQQCGSIKLLPLAGLATRIDGVPVHGSGFSGLPLQIDSNTIVSTGALGNERKTPISGNPKIHDSKGNPRLLLTQATATSFWIIALVACWILAISFCAATPSANVQDRLKGLQQVDPYIGRDFKLWNTSSIPFFFGEPAVSSMTKMFILRVVADLSAMTCLTFSNIGTSNITEYSKDADWRYINFTDGAGCTSEVLGKQSTNASHNVVLNGTLCNSYRIAAHELMHALGFGHEHSRRNRNDFISINATNILPGMQSQFAHTVDAYDYLMTNRYGVPTYDYTSLLHYGRFDFAINPNISTMQSKTDFPVPVSQEDRFSVSDIQKINLAYNCTGHLSLMLKKCVDLNYACLVYANCTSVYAREVCPKTCNICK